jgi:hypothetical protein
MVCMQGQQNLDRSSDYLASMSIFVIGHECVYSYWRCRSCGSYTIEAYEDRWDGRVPSPGWGLSRRTWETVPWN